MAAECPDCGRETAVLGTKAVGCCWVALSVDASWRWEYLADCLRLTVARLREQLAEAQRCLLREGMERDAARAALAENERDMKVITAALRTCRSELSNYERTDMGHKLSSVTEALDEADRALSEHPPVSDKPRAAPKENP